VEPSTRSLEERLDSAATGWKPNPGDRLVGTVLDLDTRDGEYGEYPIVTIQTDLGDEIAIHGFHTVLRREFAKRQPQVGERIGVKYLGKSDRGYESYRIVWENVVPPDWSKIAVEAEADAILEGVGEQDEMPAVPEDEVPF
jgi:hypothetical protein